MSLLPRIKEVSIFLGTAGGGFERGHDCMLPEELLPQLEAAIVEHLLGQVGTLLLS